MLRCPPLVDTVTMPLLLKTIVAGRLQPRQLVTHRFPFGETVGAYDTVSHAARVKTLKVILKN